MKTIDQPLPPEVSPVSTASDDTEARRAKIVDALTSFAMEHHGADHPHGPELRKILSTLPKATTGPSDRAMGLAPKDIGNLHIPGEAPTSHGEFEGATPAPPTADEAVEASAGMRPGSLEKGLAEPGIGTSAVTRMTDPHTRREFERGLDDTIAFGAGQALARQAEKLSPTPGEGGFTSEGSALDRSRAPNARAVGEMLGSLAPGGTRALTTGLGSVAGRLVSPLAGLGFGGRVTAGLLGGAATNAAAVPLIAGAQTAIAGPEEGEDVKPFAGRVADVMAGELKNPVNPIVGGALGIPVGAAAGIHGSNTQVGRDLRLVEKYGATPTPLGGAKGGFFDSPIVQGAEGSTREAGALARRASREVLGGLEGEQTALSNEYGAAKKAAGEAGFLEGMVKPDDVLSEANRLIGGQRLTRAQKAQIQTEVNDVLDAHPGGMSVDDFNDFRAKLADMADFGEGGGAAQHPALGNLFSAAKNAIDETEMGPINLKYHQGKEAIREKYSQLKLKPSTDPRVAEERVAGVILRQGENTPTSGIQEPAIEEFLQANPKYRPLFDSVALLNAKERMAAGLQSHGGTLYTRMHGALHHNIEPLQVGAYRLGMGLDDKGIAATLAARQLLGGQD